MERESARGSRRLQWVIRLLVLAVVCAAVFIAAGRLVEWNRARSRAEALAREKEVLEREIDALDREIARPVDEQYIRDYTDLQ